MYNIELHSSKAMMTDDGPHYLLMSRFFLHAHYSLYMNDDVSMIVQCILQRECLLTNHRTQDRPIHVPRYLVLDNLSILN